MKYFVYLIIAVGIFWLGRSSNDKSDVLEQAKIRENRLLHHIDSIENRYWRLDDTVDIVSALYVNANQSRGKLADQNKTLLKQLYEAKKPTYYSDSAIERELAALGYYPTN